MPGVAATPLPQTAVVITPDAQRIHERRVPELDGLRGIAVLSVVLYHYLSFAPAKHSLLYYVSLPLHLGWSGVDLFFVLSGYLIGGILIRNRGANHYFSTFYLRRLYRIVPPYYLLLIATGFGAWLWPSHMFLSTNPFWTYPVFLQNVASVWTATLGAQWLAHTWSLAVEEQFYLVLPVVVRCTSTRVLAGFALTAVISAPLLRTALITHGAVFDQIYPTTICRADALAYGILAAVIVSEEKAVQWLRQHRTCLYTGMVVAGCGCLTMLKWASFLYTGTMGYSCIDLFYFLVLLSVIVAQLTYFSRILTAPPLIWLGTISYAVYLVHEPVRFTIFRVFLGESDPKIRAMSDFGAIVACLVVTLMLGAASWALLERHLIAHAHARHKY
jgi:peptidoglycan/LPS O-acetylase OafA/YrhL